MRTKKRICITTNEFWPLIGGVGVSVDRITKMLCDEYEVHIVFFDFDGVTPDQKELPFLQGFPYINNTELSGGRVLHRIVPARTNISQSSAQIYQQCYTLLLQLQEEFSFSLFHSFYISSTGFITGLVAKKCYVPFIASVRGNDIHLHIFSQRLSQIKWTLQNADIVTCVTEELMETVNTITPCSNKAVVIHNSIDPHYFKPGQLPSELINLQKPVIGTAGVFKKKKGIEYLLSACYKLKRKFDFTLLLVGYPVASEQPYWDSLVKEISGSINLYITGKVPHTQILQYLAMMDIFVITSTSDGFPNALLEAMCTGLPIISSKTAAMQEVLMDKQDALLVKAGSPELIFEEIVNLLNDEELRDFIGNNAKRKALAVFYPDIEKKAWLQRYDQMLAPKV